MSDMVRNYLGILLLWLAAGVASAETLQVGEFRLDHAAPWQRGLARAEDVAESLILDWRGEGQAMTLFVPRRQTELRIDEKSFYRQLEQAWRSRYGSDVRIYTLPIAASHWRVFRRPSLEGDATAFQLVHVHAGKAYYLMLMRPGRVETLPSEAEALIQGVRWGSAPAMMHAESPREEQAIEASAQRLTELRAGAAQAQTNETQAGAAPLPPSPSVSPVVPWRLARSIHAVPSGAALTALSEQASSRLATEGLLSSLSLRQDRGTVFGHLQGVFWPADAASAEARQPWSRQWQWRWQLPAELAAGENTVTWQVMAYAQPGLTAHTILRARLEGLAVCGERAALIAIFDALEAGQPDAESRLRASACHREAAIAPASLLVLPDGGVGPKGLVLNVPAGWAAHTPGEAGRVKRLVLIASSPTRPERPLPGDALLAASRHYFIYVPK